MTRLPSSAQARKVREQRARAKRQRELWVALGVAGVLLCAVLAFTAIRSVAGCVSGAFSKGNDATEEQVTSKAAKKTAAVAEPVQIDLVMIGDILQHSGVYESGFNDDGTRNYDHIFAHIGSELEGADLKVLNQETLLGGATLEFSGYPSFNGPQEMGDAEAKMGFNVILRATNHAMDYGYEGLHNEMSFWRTNHPEVAVIGASDPYDSEDSVDNFYIYEKDGFKVALLNYTYDLNGYEDPQGVVSLLTESHVRATVTAADKLADMVVVFPHWGEEYNLTPVQSQYDMAQVFMDCGADVIIGGHPHVIEPVEVLTASDGRRVPCFWSVGNFVSTQIDNQNLIGGVAKVTLRKESDGLCSVTAASFVPTVTHKGLGSSMTTYLLRDYNDNLAATNYLESNGTDNTSLTVAWANQFCTEVLGPGFDVASEQLVIAPESLEPQPVFQGQAAEEGAEAADGEAEELDAAA